MSKRSQVMGLEKAIESGKDHRKPYTGAKSIALSCRNHGDCEWCKNNRMYRIKKCKEAMDDKEKDDE